MSAQQSPASKARKGWKRPLLQICTPKTGIAKSYLKLKKWEPLLIQDNPIDSSKTIFTFLPILELKLPISKTGNPLTHAAGETCAQHFTLLIKPHCLYRIFQFPSHAAVGFLLSVPFPELWAFWSTWLSCVGAKHVYPDPKNPSPPIYTKFSSQN